MFGRQKQFTILRILLSIAIWSLSRADLDVDLGFHADEHHVTVLQHNARPCTCVHALGFTHAEESLAAATFY